MPDLCPDQAIAALTEVLRREGDDLAEVDALLANYPDDPRLHFMKGSILAGMKRAFEAHSVLSRAIELAPDYHLARYQLGFFELTSGEADRALATWGPLLRLPDNAYLRQFVEGLTALIRDEFDTAIAHMREGIALNRENEPMNGDIRLLMAEAEKLARADTASAAGTPEGGEQSATSVVLGQFRNAPTRH